MPLPSKHAPISIGYTRPTRWAIAFAGGRGNFSESGSLFTAILADTKAEERRTIYPTFNQHRPHIPKSSFLRSFNRPPNMATIQGPTTEEAIALFKAIEEIFPKRTLGEDKWYLPVVSGKR
jgi:hypothetical protein